MDCQTSSQISSDQTRKDWDGDEPGGQGRKRNGADDGPKDDWIEWERQEQSPIY